MKLLVKHLSNESQLHRIDHCAALYCCLLLEQKPRNLSNFHNLLNFVFNFNREFKKQKKHNTFEI